MGDNHSSSFPFSPGGPGSRARSSPLRSGKAAKPETGLLVTTTADRPARSLMSSVLPAGRGGASSLRARRGEGWERKQRSVSRAGLVVSTCQIPAPMRGTRGGVSTRVTRPTCGHAVHVHGVSMLAVRCGGEPEPAGPGRQAKSARQTRSPHTEGSRSHAKKAAGSQKGKRTQRLCD